MWARFRRRSMAPRRPLMFRDQIPTGVLSVLLLVAGVAAVVFLVVRA